MQENAGEVMTKSVATLSYAPLHMDVQMLDDQLELTYNSFVQTRVVVLKTCWKRWIIETNGKRE